jgi:nitrite reductase (NADH) small subunit
VAEWTRICRVSEAPLPGKVMETEANGQQICLANLSGELTALDNVCPHRQGPLGQGWVEGEAVICPWHSWAFNLRSGLSEYPVGHDVAAFPVKIYGEDVFVEI